MDGKHQYQDSNTPVVPHEHRNTIALPDTQPDQPPRERTYVPVELAEIPCEVACHSQVGRRWPAMCTRAFLPGDEGRAMSMVREDFFLEECGECSEIERTLGGSFDGGGCEGTRRRARQQ